MRKLCCCSVALLVVGLLMIIIGLIVQLYVVPTVYKQKLEIREGSIQYQNWNKPTIPVYMQWYVFNMTNVENVTADKTVKPSFVQLGPYTYRENRWKANVTWNDNGTVTYKNLRWWNFVPDMSNGTEEDLIYSVNLPLVTIAEAFRYEKWYIKEVLSLLAHHSEETAFKGYTMKELIWGYHDPMMTEAMDVMPDWFYTDYVGVFAGKNYTDDGVWTVNTGENDLSKVGQAEAYNGSLLLNFWTTKYANMVNGSDGTIGPPNLNVNESPKLHFFIPDICRSLYAVYAEEEKTTQGITLYRYTSPQSELQSPPSNPDNAGFCTPVGNCLPDGAMNLSTCQLLDHFNVPIVASLPHFLFADQSYLDKLEGLKPIPSQHRTDVAIEPKTGFVMRIAKRLQINMYLQPVELLPVMADVPELVFPIAWLNESAIVDDKNQELYFSMMDLMQAANIISYVLYGVGALLVLLSIGLLIYHCVKSGKEDREPLLSSTADNASSTTEDTVTSPPPSAPGAEGTPGTEGDDDSSAEDVDLRSST